MRGPWGVLIACAVAACFSPDAADGLPCSPGPGPACPDGQLCEGDGRCHAVPSSGACPAGYVRDGDDCVDLDECEDGSADCSTNATCTNTEGGYTCACRPGFAGDGVTCSPSCATVLIYDDCTPSDANCAMIPEPLFADDAAIDLGLTVIYAGIGDQAAFRSALQAGGFDLVIVESSLGNLVNTTVNRLEQWVQDGGRIVLSYWDLDQVAALQAALDVTTTGADPMMPRDVYPDMAVSAPFDLVVPVPSPLAFTNPLLDDGDDLLTTSGVIAGHHGSPTGPGAIAVTRGGRAIVLGFLPIGLVFGGPADADADGVPDVQQLYTNLIAMACSAP